MSPDEQIFGRKPIARDNIYTVLLAMAVAMVVICAIFVVIKCYSQYGTIFTIP